MSENTTTTTTATTAATKKPRRSFTWDDALNMVEIDFLKAGKKTFDLRELPADILHRAVAHGIEQKLRDNMAMSKEEAKITTDTEYLNMTSELWNNLKEGQWNKKKEARKRGPSITVSDLEARFVEGVKKGLMTPENAKTMYTQCTGKPWMLDDSVFEVEEAEKAEEETSEEETEEN